MGNTTLAYNIPCFDLCLSKEGSDGDFIWNKVEEVPCWKVHVWVESFLHVGFFTGSLFGQKSQ